MINSDSFVADYRALHISGETPSEHMDRFKAFADKHFVPVSEATKAYRVSLLEAGVSVVMSHLSRAETLEIVESPEVQEIIRLYERGEDLGMVA